MSAVPIQRRVLPWLRVHRWRLLILFVGVLVPLWLFGELAEDVLERNTFFFDQPILLYAHTHATPLLDQMMIFFTRIGYAYGVVPVDIAIGLLFLLRRRWGDAFFWITAVGGAAILNLIAKRTFARVRPDLWLSALPETTYSFPSGHAMGSMALAAALVVVLWPTRWRWPVIVGGALFALMVGASRVYLGVHYPSDILAGWAASLAWVLGVSILLYGYVTKPTQEAEPTQTT